MKDLHMHTVFSDGKNTPEEMVQEAIRKGLDACPVGFAVALGSAAGHRGAVRHEQPGNGSGEHPHRL